MMIFDDSEVEGSLTARFRRVVVESPLEQLAVIDANEPLTYSELDRRSDALAAWLIDRIGTGGGTHDSKPVALFLPHSAASIVGMLGVVKAGHFYVPLDERQGEESLHHILQDCKSPLLITVRAAQPLGE